MWVSPQVITNVTISVFAQHTLFSLTLIKRLNNNTWAKTSLYNERQAGGLGSRPVMITSINGVKNRNSHIRPQAGLTNLEFLIDCY